MISPPPPGEQALYAAGPSGREGPMTQEELRAAVSAGQLPPDCHVWWPGLDEWVTLDSVPELAPAAPANGGPALPSSGLHALRRETASDDQLDEIFGGLVESSWKYHHLLEDTQRYDEVLVGGLITATLDTGRALLDITSDGTNHFLRFEDPEDRSRVSMSITHLTRDVTTAKAVGQRAALTVAYGEAITKFSQVIDAMRKEAKSGYVRTAEPGIVTFDKEDESKYLYSQIDLYLDVDDYISSKFEVDYDKLGAAVNACVHALRKFLKGRIEGTDD